MAIDPSAARSTVLTDPGALLRFILVLLYTGAIILIYERLSYRWSYFGFAWGNPGPVRIQSALVLGAIPAIFLPGQPKDLRAFSAWLLQVAIFVPSIAIPLLMNFQQQRDFYVAATIAACASAFNWMAGRRSAPLPIVEIFRLRAGLILTMSVVLSFGFLVYTLVQHAGSLQLSGFDNIYDQRLSFTSESTVIDAYLMPNMANVMVPFLIVIGLRMRNYLLIPIALAITVAIYAAFALKSAILAPFLIMSVYFLFNSEGNLRVALIPGVLALISLLFVPLIVFSDGGILQTIVSLLFMRTMTLPGVIVGLFSDFFATYEWTYYSHSLVGRYFVSYPYGDLSVGQIVGLFLFPVQTEPFELNGSFIATDGLAAVGMAGIPISFVVTSFALWIMTKLSSHAEPRIVFPMAVPFLLTLSNTSVFSSMITGGGLFLGVMLYLWGVARSSDDPVQASMDLAPRRYPFGRTSQLPRVKQ